MGKEENLKPFPPGVSGNPAGKKKGTKNISTYLREYLEQSHTMDDPITGKKTKKKIAQFVALQQLKNAVIDGDRQSINDVMDRLEGKPISTVITEGDKVQKIEVEFVDSKTKGNKCPKKK